MILQAWLTLPSCLASSSSPSFGSDDLLFLGHFVVSVPCAGGRVAVPACGENRAPPPAPLRKPTTIVRLSSSYYKSKRLTAMQGVIAHGVVVIGCARRDARQALKKIHDRHAEKLGEALKAAGRDAVDAQFVIRDL